jgi:YesN/AraC family two-component response regulator
MPKPTVLVVEDDDGVREAIRLVLEPEYEVIDAAEGFAARRIVETSPIDAVVLDLILPGLDGLEVLQELRATVPDVPVVVLTAVKTVRTAVGAMRLGAFNYLTKPFDEDELRATIERGVRERMRRPSAATSAQSSRSEYPDATAVIVVLSQHAGRRAAIEVALNGLGATEIAESWAELTQRRYGPSPGCVIVDIAMAPDPARVLRDLATRFPQCHVFLLGETRSAPGGPPPLVDVFRHTVPFEEIVNRIRLLRTGHATVTQSPMSAEVGQAVEWLAMNHEEEVKPASLATAIGLSTGQLSRLFRAQTGMTVKQFLTKVRVQVAKVLLAMTDDKQATIAMKVGFCDASHLSRAFVEHTGKRPGLYRRRRSP